MGSLEAQGPVESLTVGRPAYLVAGEQQHCNTQWLPGDEVDHRLKQMNDKLENAKIRELET